MIEKSKIGQRARIGAWLCMMMYFASYMTRINFAVMIVKICSDMGVEKSSLSIVLVCLTVAYGTGQVVSGFLGDHIKPVHLILGGIGVASICNVSMFFCGSVTAMAIVWCINGMAQAMLWPPMVRLLAESYSEYEYSYAVVRTSWGSSFATVLLYLVCPLLLGFMSWRYIMLVCASIGIISFIVFAVFSPRAFTENSVKKEEESAPVAPVVYQKIPRNIIDPMAFIFIGIIAMGVLRDGITNWMPSLMKESFGLSEEDSILTAVVPAIFSIISFFIFSKVQQKLIKNEVFCAACIFTIALAAASSLYFIPDGNPLVTTLLLGIVIGCMHGVNLMLISVVPKRFLKYGIVSTMAGVVNAFTYIGAAVSDYGIAIVAENRGWSTAILIWLITAGVGVAVCLISAKPWKKYMD